MDSRIKTELEKSWAPIFYKYVFCNIDEKPFSVLYSDTRRPNFPVNILLSLEYIKHLKNYSDDELIENFNFNYPDKLRRRNKDIRRHESFRENPV
ncbi:transposase [Caldanaerobacter subterraneus]|uniref:transposase n=1 Tax=Caldanaerobacter subterraneus TaxID=911092 RepID=UPI001FB6772A|nr:transposase [Caldanaerobacter subterraneus]